MNSERQRAKLEGELEQLLNRLEAVAVFNTEEWKRGWEIIKEEIEREKEGIHAKGADFGCNHGFTHGQIAMADKIAKKPEAIYRHIESKVNLKQAEIERLAGQIEKHREP